MKNPFTNITDPEKQNAIYDREKAKILKLENWKYVQKKLAILQKQYQKSKGL